MAGVRVLGVLAGDDASARLRVEWPLGALADRHDVRVAGGGWRLDAIQDERGALRSIDVPQVDVIVFQRLQNFAMVTAIPFLQAAGVAVVIDVDDDFSAVDPANPAFEGVHPSTSPDSNFQHLAAACKIADLVTVTTPALARTYGSHGRVAVLPNRLPAAVLDVPKPYIAVPPRVGWAGRVDTHPRDLQVTRGAVARVCGEHGLQVVNVGPGGIARPLGAASEHSTGFVPPWEWYPTIADQLDVAIGPLAATRFNEAKSGLRLLEASALGIPCVVSPSADNARLHALGMGVLAAKPKDWYREVGRLVRDLGWYREVAVRSKAAARGETIEGHADEWWAAWEQAAENRHVSRARDTLSAR